MEKLTLQAEPKPCPRPRVCVIKGQGRAYMPTDYRNWKDAFARLIQVERKDGIKHDGPLMVTIEVGCTRPRTSKLAFPKPDADNYAKAVLDACTDAGVWVDDCQVVNLAVFKRWSARGFPYITIEIHPLTP